MDALDSVAASGSSPASTSINANHSRILAVLSRYAADEISLDQAYYDLLEDDLIAMPKRCGLSAKIPVTKEDEEMLKKKIRVLAGDRR